MDVASDIGYPALGEMGNEERDNGRGKGGGMAKRKDILDG